MKRLLINTGLAVALLSCSKDKYETKPQLRIKSVNTKEVAIGETLSVIFEFTDKQGDVSDSLYIFRERLNVHGPVTTPKSDYKLPNFPETTKGEIEVNFRYAFDLTATINEIRIPGSNPSRNEPDTMRLKFVVKDKGGNFSDTAVLDNLFVQR
jgi:hypothetical protein